MDIKVLYEAIAYIKKVMCDNKDYLVELDARNGDGDLGITMSKGFTAVYNYLSTSEETDLGRALMKCSSVFNETAPSTLGTIMSLGMMGMAKSLKGMQQASLDEVVAAMENGINQIMNKAKSKPGEKTILDAIFPAVNVLKQNVNSGKKTAFRLAFEAANEGMHKTKDMKSVHGRAAYYGEKSVGLIDAGAVAGKLLFEALSIYVNSVSDLKTN